MTLPALISALQELPADLQGKAREGERLLELRRNTEAGNTGESALSLRLTITLRDDTAGELMFDALLQLPAAPGDKSPQLKAVDGRDFNKREQRCVEPMISWANQILSERQELIKRSASRKPAWQAPLQKVVSLLSQDETWARQWLMQHEFRLETLSKKARIDWVLRELGFQGHIARVDWKDDEAVIDDTVMLLEKHFSALKAEAALEPLEDSDEFEDVEEAIAAVNLALQPWELKLYEIECKDDAYVLTLQSAAAAEQLQQALSDLGLSLQDFDA